MSRSILSAVSTPPFRSVWRSVINNPSSSLASLIIYYDDITSSISVTTTSAGSLYWAMFGAGGAISADVISGVGSSHNGYVDTIAGSIGIDLPSPSAGEETWLACLLVISGVAVSAVAETRIQEGATTTYAGITAITGSPTVYDYVDGEGTWRAYEFLGDGSFTIGAPGDVEHLLVAGGGGAGGMSYVGGAGGGAGGLLHGTAYRTAGTYPVTVGLGGAGSYGSTAPIKGGNSTALGLIAIGGGCADEVTAANRNGGSGAGRKAGVSTGQGTGVVGQGFDGAASPNTGGDSAAGGGGGAGGVGGSPTGTLGGNGGAGITLSILGTAKGFAGGGVGGTNTATTTASGSHGAPVLGATTTNRKGADGVNGTGAGGSGSMSINASSLNQGGKGGNGVVIIRVRLA